MCSTSDDVPSRILRSSVKIFSRFFGSLNSFPSMLIGSTVVRLEKICAIMDLVSAVLLAASGAAVANSFGATKLASVMRLMLVSLMRNLFMRDL